MEKSFVSMEQRLCKVTGKPYDTGSLILDSRLKDSMEKNTVVGWGLSPEVVEKIEAGFIALVEVDYEKSTVVDGTIKPSDAYRLQRIAYLKRPVMESMFNTDSKDLPMVFIDTTVFNDLEKLAENLKQE